MKRNGTYFFFLNEFFGLFSIVHLVMKVRIMKIKYIILNMAKTPLFTSQNTNMPKKFEQIRIQHTKKLRVCLF